MTDLIVMPRYQPYFLVELNCGDVIEVHDAHPRTIIWKHCPGCDRLQRPVYWMKVPRG